MIVRELLTRWGFKVDDKGIRSANRKLKNFGKRVDAIAQKATAMGKTLSLRLTLPLVALGAVLVKTASDAEETESKFATVFRSVSTQSEQMAKDLATNFGLSRLESKTLLSDTGDLLTGFGFTGEAALDLSGKVQKLAVDLASFTNFSGGASGASRALTKALLGERESIKSLGISIQEEDVKRKVALLTAQGMTFATERQAKAFATLTLAQEQSKNAIGDFARTSQGFANQLRIMKARANDVAVSFGKILLPIALKLVQAVGKLLTFFEDLSPSMKRLILIVAGVAAAAGPLLLIFGQFAGAIRQITFALRFLRIAGITAFLPMIATVLAVVAALAVLFLVAEDLFRFFRGETSFTGAVVKKFQEQFPELSKTVSTAFNFMKEAALLWFEVLKFGFNAIMKLGAILVDNVLRPIGDLLGAIVGQIIKVVTGIAEIPGVNSLLQGAFSGGANLLRSARTAIAGANESVTGTPAAAAAGAGGNVTVMVDAPITVPPGTPPELVGNAVKEGVKEAMGESLRNASLATEPQVQF